MVHASNNKLLDEKEEINPLDKVKKYLTLQQELKNL
jgi:hypothetical protein